MATLLTRTSLQRALWSAPKQHHPTKTATRAMSKKSEILLVRNGQIVKNHGHASYSEVLFAHPKGVYTSARTFERTSILFYNKQIDRLCKAPQAIDEKAEALDFELVNSYVTPNIKLALEAFWATSDPKTHEAHITILLFPSGTTEEGKMLSKYTVCVVVDPLLERPGEPVKVEIRQMHRDNPKIKHLGWASQRKEIMAAKAPDANEVLMTDERGEVSEGLSSNFFSIEGGTVFTAGDDKVLAGTVRDLIIAVCSDLGIPVEFRSPNATKCAEWEGAFVSSTSRLLLPIGTAHFIAENKVQTIKQSELAKKILAELQNVLRLRATKIL